MRSSGPRQSQHARVSPQHGFACHGRNGPQRASREAASRGFTLVELVFASALATLVMVGLVGLLTHGTRLLEISRQTSSTQEDARKLFAIMARDAGELLYFVDGDPFDSGGAARATGFRFVVRSNRVEEGLEVPDGPTLRRVEYSTKVGLKGSSIVQYVRSVTLLEPAAPAGAGGGGSAAGRTVRRSLVPSLTRLRIEPLAAVPAAAGGGYELVPASDGRARQAGASPMCLVVSASLGDPAGTSSVERTPATTLVTKLWCRNRLLELSRGNLP